MQYSGIEVKRIPEKDFCKSMLMNQLSKLVLKGRPEVVVHPTICASTTD